MSVEKKVELMVELMVEWWVVGMVHYSVELLAE